MPWGKRWCSDELVIRIDLIFPEGGKKRRRMQNGTKKEKKVCVRFCFWSNLFWCIIDGGRGSSVQHLLENCFRSV